MALTMTVLTIMLIVVFFAVLIYALARIGATLESIGGTPTSYFAKLRMGLRAIAKETSHLAPRLTQVNAGLTGIAGGLGSVQAHLENTFAAVAKQPQYQTKAQPQDPEQNPTKNQPGTGPTR